MTILRDIFIFTKKTTVFLVKALLGSPLPALVSARRAVSMICSQGPSVGGNRRRFPPRDPGYTFPECAPKTRGRVTAQHPRYHRMLCAPPTPLKSLPTVSSLARAGHLCSSQCPEPHTRLRSDTQPGGRDPAGGQVSGVRCAKCARRGRVTYAPVAMAAARRKTGRQSRIISFPVGGKLPERRSSAPLRLPVHFSATHTVSPGLQPASNSGKVGGRRGGGPLQGSVTSALSLPATSPS